MLVLLMYYRLCSCLCLRFDFLGFSAICFAGFTRLFLWFRAYLFFRFDCPLSTTHLALH